MLCFYIQLFFFPPVSPEGSVTITPDRIDASFGDDVSFNCTSFGGPNNQYEWTHVRTGESVSNDSQLTLSLTSLDLFGEYKCIVSNAAGNDSDTALLNGKNLSNKLN